MIITMKDLDRRVNLQNGLECNLYTCNWNAKNLILSGSCKGRQLKWSDTGMCINPRDPSHDIVSFVYSRHREVTKRDIGRNVVLYDGRLATITEWEASRPNEMKGTCEGEDIRWYAFEHLWVAALRGDERVSKRENNVTSFIEDPPPPTRATVAQT
jgi:hypothetical protein